MISFNDALNRIYEGIHSIEYPAQPKGLYEPMAYLLDLKGKKVRPALTLLGADLFSDTAAEDSLNTALAWEIFHNFTLMHDDVMDNADVRRGQPTVHKKWDENTAVLSGDAMLILAYVYMTKSPLTHLKTLLDLFSKTADEICAGQQYDIEFEKRLDVTEEEYIRMISLKTAVMIGASLQSGSIIGGASQEDQEHLYQFGMNLGIAFQIKDDYLDTYGNEAVFGKRIGGDILCNKKTFLLINALNAATQSDREELLVLLSNNDQTQEKIDAVKAIYQKTDVALKAETAIGRYFLKALQAFEKVSIASERKQVLLDFAHNLMQRES